jgi:hypothetical protein
MSTNADVYHFSNESFNLTMNASINAEGLSTENTALYDYILTLNTDLNNFFNNKTYTESKSNVDDAVVDLVVNNTALSAAINNILIHTNSDAEMTGTLSGASTVKLRYMEMIALKLFGHGAARSAINNDVELVSDLPSNLNSHITNLVSNRKNDIFKAYFSSTRPSNSDSQDSNNGVFNFNSQTLSFPGWLNGDIVDKSEVESSIKNRNHAVVGGITNVEDGHYNIKILFRIGDQDESDVMP